MKNTISVLCLAGLAGCASLSARQNNSQDIVIRVDGYPLTVAVVQAPVSAGSYEMTPQHVMAVAKPKPEIRLRAEPRVVQPMPAPRQQISPPPPVVAQKPPEVVRSAPGDQQSHWVVHFDFDEAELKDADRQALEAVAKRAHGTVLVIGYTDSVGASEYNKKLSVRRAEAVRAFLIAKGIPSANIHLRGEGKTHPVASNSTEKGRGQNRRAEIETAEQAPK